MQDSNYSFTPGRDALKRADPGNQLSRITYQAVGGPYKKRPRKIIKQSFDEQPAHSGAGGCPCWLLTLLSILALVGLAALVLMGIGYYRNKTAGASETDNSPEIASTEGDRPASQNISSAGIRGQAGTSQPSRIVRAKPIVCAPGFFAMNGKCLKCPNGSRWNGTNCVRKVLVKTVTDISPSGSLSFNHQEAGNPRQTESQLSTQPRPSHLQNK